jgi:hypothetical protein
MPDSNLLAGHSGSSRIWAIAAFFNPAGYKGRKICFKTFRDSSKRQGLRLLVVELAFDDRAFEIEADDCERLVQIRSSPDQILWQKERLLNVALAHLPDECDQIIWIDTDLIFENSRWVDETSRALEEHVVVQPFSSIALLPQGITSIEQAAIQGLDFAGGVLEGQKLSGFAFGFSTNAWKELGEYTRHGHPGYAWAARRELFEATGFYDRMILGGADYFMAMAFAGHWAERFALLEASQSDAMKQWFSQMGQKVARKIGYVEGTAYHLWHGDQVNRRYTERCEILKQHAFDPNLDIRIGRDGIWEWATFKPRLHREVRRYFWTRQEDPKRFLWARAGLRKFKSALKRFLRRK